MHALSPLAAPAHPVGECEWMYIREIGCVVYGGAIVILRTDLSYDGLRSKVHPYNLFRIYRQLEIPSLFMMSRVRKAQTVLTPFPLALKAQWLDQYWMGQQQRNENGSRTGLAYSPVPLPHLPRDGRTLSFSQALSLLWPTRQHCILREPLFTPPGYPPHSFSFRPLSFLLFSLCCSWGSQRGRGWDESAWMSICIAF